MVEKQILLMYEWYYFTYYDSFFYICYLVAKRSFRDNTPAYTVVTFIFKLNSNVFA